MIKIECGGGLPRSEPSNRDSAIGVNANSGVVRILNKAEDK
jgi:hypothetical protein